VAKVLCTRPNASDNISGYPFEPHPDSGMISVDDLPEEVVKAFVRIDGYQAVETDPPPNKPFEPGDPAAERTEEAVQTETGPDVQNPEPPETETPAPGKSGRRTKRSDIE
jgi:hypothetical protein